jgi:hypothetical protein
MLGDGSTLTATDFEGAMKRGEDVARELAKDQSFVKSFPSGSFLIKERYMYKSASRILGFDPHSLSMYYIAAYLQRILGIDTGAGEIPTSLNLHDPVALQKENEKYIRFLRRISKERAAIYDKTSLKDVGSLVEFHDETGGVLVREIRVEALEEERYDEDVIFIERGKNKPRLKHMTNTILFRYDIKSNGRAILPDMGMGLRVQGKKEVSHIMVRLW